MFSDFQCPYCGVFDRENLPTLQEQFVKTGKVRLVFSHLPSPQHEFAFNAAVAAECANEQGKFVEMHETLFRHQDALTDDDLASQARSVGLEMNTFRRCLTTPAVGQKVRRLFKTAMDLKITSTPTFFIGMVDSDGRLRVDQKLSGAYSAASIGQALGEELKKVG